MTPSCMFWKCLCDNNNEGRAAVRLAGKAYQSLSLEEQRGVDEMLYGSTSSSETETPEFVASKLQALDKELNLLSEDRKKAYSKAIAMEQSRLQQQEEEENNNGGLDEKYIGSDKFRLQFLRAELFDARLAARRLVEYFQHKYELFGEEALARRIQQQADFNNEDQEALVSGVLAYNGAIDSVGRPVLIFRRSYLLYFSVSCIKRIFFYIFQTVMENNEIAQKKGYVFIMYHVNMPFVNPAKARSYYPVSRMSKHGLPIRHAAVHIYYNNVREHVLLNFILVLYSKTERARFLPHLKYTHYECMLNAMAFGINPEHLPFTDGGDIQYETICNYWEGQKQLEEQKSDM